MPEQEINEYVRKKKGGKRKCVKVKGYKRNIPKAKEQIRNNNGTFRRKRSPNGLRRPKCADGCKLFKEYKHRACQDCDQKTEDSKDGDNS